MSCIKFKTNFFDAIKMLSDKKGGNPYKYSISYINVPSDTKYLNYFDNITFTANNRFDLWLKVYDYLCNKDIDYANFKFYEEEAYMLVIEDYLTMVNMMNLREYFEITKNGVCESIEDIYNKTNQVRINNLLWNLDKELYESIEDINIRFIIHQLMYAFETGNIKDIFFSNTKFTILSE